VVVVVVVVVVALLDVRLIISLEFIAGAGL
jgi:hypothetical protein